MKLILRVALLVAVPVLLVGCGGDGDGPRGIEPVGANAAVDPQQPIPSVTKDVVLQVRGGRDATKLDLPTLRRLPQATLTVDEPFRRREMSFTGVRVSDLIAGGRSSAGDELYLHALDNYHVELPLDRLRDGDALLAWEADGQAIPTAEGGPLRVVFPDDSPLSDNRDNWIWSVDWMQVR